MSAENNGNDIRVFRTKKVITEAFARLLEKKGFQAIKIQDIADEALINRSTFYAHYNDKYDLLEKHTAYVLSRFSELPAGRPSVNNEAQMVEYYQTLFDELFHHVAENAQFIKAMLKESPEFEHRLQETVYREILNRLKVITNTPRTYLLDIDEKLFDTLFANYYSSACVGVIKWWLDTGMIYSPKHVSHIFIQISLLDVFTLYGVKRK